MLPQKPRVFISAVTSELSQAREIVARTVRVLGYEAVYQTEFITQPGKLIDYLRELIDKSELVIQLVGDKYGAEPRQTPEGFDRCSYTQFELLYAEKQKKKILVVECGPSVRDPGKEVAAALAAATPEPTATPADHAEGDAPVIGRDDRAFGLKQPPDDEQAQLQQDYLARIKNVGYKREKVSSPEGLEIAILKLRKDLGDLWKKYLVSMAVIYALLLTVLGIGAWSLLVSKKGFQAVQAGVNKVQGTVEQVGTQVAGVQQGVDGIGTTLQKPGAGNGRLVVQSNPKGALAFRQRQRGIPLPLRQELPAGTYAFTFFLPGYETESRDLTLQSGEINDLGVIHFKPSTQKSDPNATSKLGEILRDPLASLDREIWVWVEIRDIEDSATLTFLTPADIAHYQYYRLYGDMTRDADYKRGLASGRVPMEKAGEFVAALRAQATKIFHRRDVREKAYIEKTGHWPFTGLYSHIHGRVKIRIDSQSFILGGPDPKLGGIKFVCDVLAWDFAQMDAEDDKKLEDDIAGMR